MGRFRLGGVLLFGLLFAVTPAQAHNWIEGTRGRAALLGASQFCTPTFPQLNRNEIHMQVGVNQPFVVEWAAAHTDYTYFAIIHDSDSDKVNLLTRSFMNSWLSMCKTSNAANDTTGPWTKVHRFNMNFNLASTEPVLGGAMPPTPTYGDIFRPNAIISGPIWNAFGGDRSTLFYRPGTSGVGGYTATQGGINQDLFILPFNNTGKPNTILAQYKDFYMLNDLRCDSSNHNATWIESIARFSHQEVGRAVSAALLKIQAKKGPGRYQVHYRWASYCDVMDVDVRATNVANPYGTPRNGTANYLKPFNEGHHCLFNTPNYAGQCIEVVTDTTQCQAICNNDGNCKGYQLIPLQRDPAASGDRWGQFSGETFIPWLGTGNYNRSRCDKAQFENKNIPALGAMICYPILQFTDDFNAARPLWSFTADMDHQGFYGTCYLRPRAVDFLNFTDLASTQDNQYRFLDKCIPCDNIGSDMLTPRWGPKQNYCTDCTKYPVPPKKLAIPTWTAVGPGTFQDAAHWLSPGGSPFATADECKLLAERDPTCSKFVMHSENRTTLMLMNYNYAVSGKPLWIRGGGFYAGYFNWTNAMTVPYYRSCACLDANPTTLAANYTPALDASQLKLACTGLTNATCAVRAFVVYKLA